MRNNIYKRNFIQTIYKMRTRLCDTSMQNQKAKQGKNLETLKRNKQTQKQLHISQ